MFGVLGRRYRLWRCQQPYCPIQVRARVITHETCALRVRAEEILQQVDQLQALWQVDEGQWVEANAALSTSRAQYNILTAERVLMNFCRHSQLWQPSHAVMSMLSWEPKRVFTIPAKHCQACAMLRNTPQPAVVNHRMGLFDAVMLKENHLIAHGSIAAMVKAAKDKRPTLPIIVEVESLEECKAALACAVDVILLDNFTVDEMSQAVTLCAGKIPLEASGNVCLANVLSIAQSGVDRISIGALTTAAIIYHTHCRIGMVEAGDCTIAMTGFLGFAADFPLMLTTSTLQVWLADRWPDMANVSLGAIGLLGLPYLLKGLWSPIWIVTKSLVVAS